MTAIFGSVVYGRVVPDNGNGVQTGGILCDCYFGPSGGNSTTTKLSYGTGAGGVLQVLPFTTNSTFTSVPAVGAAPTGKGLWVTPTLAKNPLPAQVGSDMNEASYWSRQVPAGVWTVALGFSASVAQLGTPNTLTVILYKMTSATAGTEITRVTQAFGSGLTTSAFALPLPTIAAQTFNYGETFCIEIYLQAAGSAVVGQTLTMPIDSSSTTGGGASASLPNVAFPGTITATIAEPTTGAPVKGVAGAGKVVTRTEDPAGSASTGINGSPRAASVAKPGGGAGGASSSATRSVTAAKPGGASGVGNATATKALAVTKSGGAIETAVALATRTATVTKGFVGAASLQAGSTTKGTAVTKSGGASGHESATAHYQLVTYTISGNTRDASSNAIIGSCAVVLFDDATNSPQQSATSNATTGAYTFIVPSAFSGWVSAYLSGSPDTFGRTQRGLTPTQTVVQSG